MKNTHGLLFAALLAVLPLAAQADDTTIADGKWSGAGEVGFAAVRGNAKSENLNAKLAFKMEDETWKDTFYLTALRAKGEVSTPLIVNGQISSIKTYQATANRYEVGASAGYKFDERSYLVGAVRYENDDFSSYQYQAVVSLGYGYTVLKTASDELSLEVGPGYKRFERKLPANAGSQGEAIGRGLVNFKHAFSANTAFVNTLLVEAGSKNTFLQNDAGLQVDINKKLALKVGYQVRHNTDAPAGTKKTDQLMTTNLVYNFGG
ncbi:MAG: DUF481 domain-containing protein [Dokdonella sp.]|uniref:DUF481 domain-containing protein n=1 Tax=Dokdonella sp. TaxID=2291710 RepID=UPI0025BAF119|nr:DUF481 domain-containing protein [Dokdonella sp.]MBZ0222284.1 DUF481 domain-containing protein [Dokdonella sp.]MCC7255590.1 DUF481 domain-containing protein [Dokdonella sp.]